MKKTFSVVTSIVFIIVTAFFLFTLVNFINFRNQKFFEEFPLPGDFDLTKDPNIKVTEVLTGLSNPWDMTFINRDFFYYSQRIGEIRGHNIATNEDFLLVKPENAYIMGEGGLLSVQKDTDFDNNHYLYNCMNVKNGDSPPAENVTRWKISNDLKQVLESKVIISDMTSNTSGRHSGCRIAESTDGTIWVGTGDNAFGTHPQDPKSLNGKVLHIDRDGNGVDGNLAAPFDTRIYNYGHRNIQGIVLFPKPVNGVFGLTAEHGTGKDDEINLLKPGNFGWDPIPEYNESVEMTDTVKYPDAIPAIWSSGDPTIAISGMAILKGNRWQAWEGDVLVAVLKDKYIRLQKYDENWKILRDDKILTGYGRIRAVVQGLDGDLYVTTDNGGGTDKILRVTPE